MCTSTQRRHTLNRNDLLDTILPLCWFVPSFHMDGNSNVLSLVGCHVKLINLDSCHCFSSHTRCFTLSQMFSRLLSTVLVKVAAATFLVWEATLPCIASSVSPTKTTINNTGMKMEVYYNLEVERQINNNSTMF